MESKIDILVYNFMDVFYGCIIRNSNICEEKIPNHTLVYLIDGELVMDIKDKRIIFKKGDAFLLRRNHLPRVTKRLAKKDGLFKGIFLELRPAFLKSFVAQNRISLAGHIEKNRNLTHEILPKHPFLNGLFLSLEQYFDSNTHPTEKLMINKLNEAVLALLKVRPEFGDMLFDFEDPWKIDLESFMLKYFKSNLSLNEFANYTGRSLTTFKRDFKSLFNETPSRWVMKQRLKEAYDLISLKHAKPSEIYLEVGFNNFSHFSASFIKEFGQSPSSLLDDHG
ncbi:AraC-like DNA-binding protein [Pedobacter cryoconitis]|uniref:AraC-like DNA-binding protein n=1 Tax=Pedobacter cryoconitis TaxID=188932 RepID=A0A7W9DZL2_9SPHI|nr:AraC family transcriptional regulator [Pedobacter cryoconitis]MBB5637101.1 AraC-like DNA-binding protein [Pedobacter cryoconitis]